MSTALSQYTVETLQDYDNRSREMAETFGLPLPDVSFHLCQAEEIYDIAARSLPHRYSHYRFGRSYQEQKSAYDKGHGRIYELVINTTPCHAYLLDGNGLIAQLLVIAHVYGHAAVFENSAYFAPADKNILSRVRSAAERIDGYIGEYGRPRVEDFIDACEALQYQRSFDILGKPRAPKGPEWEEKKYDQLYPEETQRRREEFVAEKEAFKIRFPKQPERDILAFLEAHARRLEDWQKDVISIIRTETEYFAPQMRTQVINEGTAVYYHQTIVNQLMIDDSQFTTDDFMEFQSMNARVLHPKIQLMTEEGEPWLPEYVEEEDWKAYVHCMGMNPYLTGTEIFREIKRICEDPTEKELEKWPYWAGKISWEDKRNELIRGYDDVALLSEFLSPAICERAKLFMRPRTREEYKELCVLKEEFEEVREVLVQGKTEISPCLEIVDADHNNRGELYLEHRHHDIGLDNEYAKGTLPHLVTLWGHPVVIKTLGPGTGKPDPDLPECWYRCEPGKDPVRDTAPL